MKATFIAFVLSLLALPCAGQQHYHSVEPVPGASGFHTFPHAEVGLEYRDAGVRIHTHPDAGWTVERLTVQQYSPPIWSFWNGLRFEEVSPNVYTIVGTPIYQGNLEFRLWMLVSKPIGNGQFDEVWVSQEWYVITAWPKGHGLTYKDTVAPDGGDGCALAATHGFQLGILPWIAITMLLLWLRALKGIRSRSRVNPALLYSRVLQ